MKRFLIAVIAAILMLTAWDTAYYRLGFYVDFQKNKPVTAAAKTNGKGILIDAGDGFEPFEIRGVNLDSGIPGHFPTEYAIDRETYLRWFRQIKDMGANTIRVYTILSPEFYRAFYEYNSGNPDPLYLLHGVRVDDYTQNSHVDAFDKSFSGRFREDCKTLVDVIHGRKKISLNYNGAGAGGTYNKDVSEWVIGYILGVDWDESTVAYTDHMEEKQNSYHGEYLYTADGASPFEVMLAEAGDNMIRYETERYKEQRLVSFSNWPSTDPMEYSEDLRMAFAKFAKVDMENICSTDRLISGRFASYRICPHYSDYMREYTEWILDSSGTEKNVPADSGRDAYAVYFEMLNQYHTIPVVASEFGVSSSRGAAGEMAAADNDGRVSEKEQGEALTAGYRRLKQAGGAGFLLTAWQDEWSGHSWNTMANVDLSKAVYWSDFQTGEQSFGLLTFDPGNERNACYPDGNTEEWKDGDRMAGNAAYSLSMRYDEEFVYFLVHKREGEIGSETIYIPVDTTPESGSYYDKDRKLRFSRQADFLLVLDGKEKSRLLVQARSDAFRAVFGRYVEGKNPYGDPPDKDSPEFGPIRMMVRLQRHRETGTAETKLCETGKLLSGNGNPESPDFCSVSDFMIYGSDAEIRIPWQLLNFSDPSNRQIHADYYEQNGIENLRIKAVYAGIGSSSDTGERIEMGKLPLERWGKEPTFHERLKQSYYIVRDAWRQQEE
ncbi:MAG: hypothetical protein MR528_11225 [Lachnospiraceae bacterium]|nr:hypothetical protein [Lachnospiraceae bacterium]